MSNTKQVGNKLQNIYEKNSSNIIVCSQKTVLIEQVKFRILNLTFHLLKLSSEF